jgi:hypothetical protein
LLSFSYDAAGNQEERKITCVNCRTANYYLARKYELKHRENISDYSIELVKEIQKDFLRKFDEMDG